MYATLPNSDLAVIVLTRNNALQIDRAPHTLRIAVATLTEEFAVIRVGCRRRRCSCMHELYV